MRQNSGSLENDETRQATTAEAEKHQAKNSQKPKSAEIKPEKRTHFPKLTFFDVSTANNRRCKQLMRSQVTGSM